MGLLWQSFTGEYEFLNGSDGPGRFPTMWGVRECTEERGSPVRTRYRRGTRRAGAQLVGPGRNSEDFILNG